jgi:hypothetical protein
LQNLYNAVGPEVGHGAPSEDDAFTIDDVRDALSDRRKGYRQWQPGLDDGGTGGVLRANLGRGDVLPVKASHDLARVAP